LHTGHCVIDTERGVEIADRVTTKVTFSEMSEVEIDDYIASKEPLQVAGGFTLDGFGSPFISVIEGDYTNVVGISMPFLRSAMKELGYSWPEVKEMR
jgi:septum formation protein